MPNKRKTILEKLVEESKISKQAQLDPGTVEEAEVDKATADKIANDIFDKIFDEELSKLINSIS